ncbi:MAG: Smr/MutS family protein [Deltaproteobacteria bacterium]|nr:Smr/MutS family protein [Deltaproteobacteria bacterium]
MKYKIGDRVYIKQFRKEGTIASEANGKGLYKVEVDNFSIMAPDSLLGTAKDNKTTMSHFSTPSQTIPGHGKITEVTIDLHGLTVTQAIDKTTKAIDRAILLGVSTLIINHGKGEGKLKEAIHRHLPTLRQVKSYNLSPLNPGLTLAHF